MKPARRSAGHNRRQRSHNTARNDVPLVALACILEAAHFLHPVRTLERHLRSKAQGDEFAWDISCISLNRNRLRINTLRSHCFRHPGIPSACYRILV
jgi:hypothetical protein